MKLNHIKGKPPNKSKNYVRTGGNKQQYKWTVVLNNGKTKTIWADSRYNATHGQLSPEEHIIGIKSAKKAVTESIDDGVPQHQQLLHCFDNAWRALMAMEKAGESDGVNLVHAMVTNAEGRNFAHGWLEKDGNAMDFARDADKPQVMNAAKYREAIQAKNVVEYEALRAMINGAKHGNYGPWESNLI